MKKRYLRRKERLLIFKMILSCMHEKISNATTVVDRYNKLKDLNSQLKTMYNHIKDL